MSTAPRRRRIRLFRPLAIGALITVVTAWAGAMTSPPTSISGLQRAPRSQGNWDVDISRNWVVTKVRYALMQISGRQLMIPQADFESRALPDNLIPPHLRPASLDDLTIWASYEESGFPFPALSCSIHWGTQANSVTSYVVRGGIFVRETANGIPLALPAAPLAPGFIADMCLWGAAALVVEAACARALAGRRRRRGVCAECRFNRAGLEPGAPCPECGLPGTR